MSAPGGQIEHYRAAFDAQEAQAAAPAPEWLRSLRLSALESFSKLGFPTTRLEDWKYTNVTPLARQPFELGPPGEGVTRGQLEPFLFPDLEGRLFVFVNGRFAPDLSSPAEEDGIRVESLAEAMPRTPALAEHLGRHADFTKRSFVALNSAFLGDGAVVRISGAADPTKTIHLLHVSRPGNAPSVSHPRILILAEPSSQATIFEDYVSLPGGARLTNAVTEIVTERNASVDHVRLQREDLDTFHVGCLDVHQARDSRFVSHAVSLGGALSRSDFSSVLGGEGSECVLNGLYVASDTQHVDNQTRVDHAQPHCSSSELYKGILDDKARGVFNGRIVVRPDAQKTDARQQNKNLLLADGAEMNTKPQLEIYADDVKCSHGSTIGRLDEGALFYLRSRGIEESRARALLTRAFASEVVDGIGPAPIRRRIEELLLERIHLSRALGETA